MQIQENRCLVKENLNLNDKQMIIALHHVIMRNNVWSEEEELFSWRQGDRMNWTAAALLGR